MIYGESFRPRDTFSSEQTGMSEPILRLSPNNFDGPVASWASDRTKLFGEKVVPKEVYIDQPANKKAHRVAWVFHEGLSNISGEPFAMHHVACDCSGYAEEAVSYEERQRILSECPALIPVIEKHADLVNTSYRITEILNGLSYDPNMPVKRQGATVRDFVAGTILGLMERDYAHPESWIANVESGWTIPELMSLVLKISPEDVADSVDGLVESGQLAANGVMFGLAQHRKDTLDLNSRFDQIMSQLL